MADAQEIEAANRGFAEDECNRETKERGNTPSGPTCSTAWLLRHGDRGRESAAFSGLQRAELLDGRTDAKVGSIEDVTQPSPHASDESTSPPIRRARRKVGWAVGSLAAWIGGLVIFCELLAAVLEIPRAPLVHAIIFGMEGTETIHQPDDEVLWVLRPNATVNVYGDKISALGHRSPERPIVKGPQARRVVFLGDSVAFGAGVRYEHSFAGRIERWLADAKAGTWESWNLAVGAHTAAQTARMLERRALVLSPDIVVICAGSWSEYSPAIGEPDDAVLARLDESARSHVVAALRGRGIVRILSWWTALGDGGRESAEATPQLAAFVTAGQAPGIVRVDLAAFRVHLLRMVERSRAAGAVPVLVVPGATSESRAHFPDSDRYAAAIRQVGKEMSVAVADVRAALAASGADAVNFFDRVHLSEEGHRIAARVIAESLCSVPSPDLRGISPQGIALPRSLDFARALRAIQRSGESESEAAAAAIRESYLHNWSSVMASPPSELVIPVPDLPERFELCVGCAILEEGSSPIRFVVELESTGGVRTRLLELERARTVRDVSDLVLDRVLGARPAEGTRSLRFRVEGTGRTALWIRPSIVEILDSSR